MTEHVEITPELIEIRHYLHAHPERSFKEFKTSATLSNCSERTTSNPEQSARIGCGRLIRGEQPGPAHRIARRHRRSSHSGRHGIAILLGQRWSHARLRPRPAHVISAGSGILACQTPQTNQGIHQTAVPAVRRNRHRRTRMIDAGTAGRRLRHHRRAQQPQLCARADCHRP